MPSRGPLIIRDRLEYPLAKEIHDGSDRTAVILAMAWVDDAMKACLVAHFRDDERERLQLVGPNGPLGSFGARLRILYLLGRMNADSKNDLRLMAKLRNEAAHLTEPFDFSRPNIRERVEKLHLHDRILGSVEDDEMKKQLRSRPFSGDVARDHFLDCARLAAGFLLHLGEHGDLRAKTNFAVF